MKEDDTGINIKFLFAKNLRRLRNDMNMSQLDLAAITGLSHNYINDIEHEKKWPSYKTIAILAKALKTEPHQFLLAETKWNIKEADLFKEELSGSIAMIVKEHCDRYITNNEQDKS